MMVFSHGDDNYKIHSQSGFSCHQLIELNGFHAGKKRLQVINNWAKLTEWRVRGKKGLYSFGGGFNTVSGTFVALKTGVYFCAAQIRFDRTMTEKDGLNTVTHIRLQLRVNEEIDAQNGLYAVEGNRMSNNRHSLNVAGTVRLKAGWRISTWVYSNVAAQIHPESGFSCHYMPANKGFHADLSRDINYRQGWSLLKGWRTWENNELYSWGGRPSATGIYSATESGFYFCAAQVSFLKFVIACEGNFCARVCGRQWNRLNIIHTQYQNIYVYITHTHTHIYIVHMVFAGASKFNVKGNGKDCHRSERQTEWPWRPFCGPG